MTQLFPSFDGFEPSMGSKTGRVEMSAAPADENNVSTIDRACNDYNEEHIPSFRHWIAAALPPSRPTPRLKSMSDCVYFSSSESQNATQQMSKYYHRTAASAAARNARTQSPRGVYSRKSFWKQPYFCAGETPSPQFWASVQTIQASNIAVTLTSRAIQRVPEGRIEVFSDAFATGAAQNSIFPTANLRAAGPEKGRAARAANQQ
jgi:hypothetical protein